MLCSIFVIHLFYVKHWLASAFSLFCCVIIFSAMYNAYYPLTICNPLYNSSVLVERIYYPVLALAGHATMLLACYAYEIGNRRLFFELDKNQKAIAFCYFE